MKKKKIIIAVSITCLILLTIFATYLFFYDKQQKIRYIALGDSIAEGMNAYSQVEYGYTDYIKDYLEEHDKLSFYTKGFSKSGYTTNDLKNDIENNKKIIVDEKNVYLKEALRESDLVTLTIGANNYIKDISFSNIEEKISNIENVKKTADKIASEVENLIILIKQYAKNQIIVTGYFNPVPKLLMYKKEIDEIILYYNHLIEEICEELDVDYVDIFGILDGNTEALPNALNIHPNKYGYQLIANEIIKVIKG